MNYIGSYDQKIDKQKWSTYKTKYFSCLSFICIHNYYSSIFLLNEKVSDLQKGLLKIVSGI